MNGMIVVLVAAVVLAAGYLLYGRWLARTWGIDREALTPAKRMEDGKNFSPASCFTAFSHQFSSICGAGPVTGTIAAMMFGWLPVVLWVLVGGIFFGAVHDFGALYASVKNNGKSLAQLVEKYIGRTGRRLFLLFSWLFTIIVIAAFVDMVAGTFMTVANAQTGAVDFAASYAGGAAGTISILFTFVAIAFGWINRRFGLTGWRELVLAVALFVAMFAVGMQFPVYLDKLGWFAVITVYLLFAAACHPDAQAAARLPYEHHDDSHDRVRRGGHLRAGRARRGADHRAHGGRLLRPRGQRKLRVPAALRVRRVRRAFRLP